MSTPVYEKEQYSFPAFEPENIRRRSSDEDGTLKDEVAFDERIDHNHLRVTTSYADAPDNLQRRGLSPASPSATREQSRRLDDDLEMLRIERVVSNTAAESEAGSQFGKSRSMARSRSRTTGEPIDDFDVDTAPVHEHGKIYQPPQHPTTNFAKMFKKIHNSSWLVRYFFYITPIVLLLLIPLLLGALLFKDTSVGGVKLLWFSIWLEIVWLTLWAGRVSLSCVQQ